MYIILICSPHSYDPYHIKWDHHKSNTDVLDWIGFVWPWVLTYPVLGEEGTMELGVSIPPIKWGTYGQVKKHKNKPLMHCTDNWNWWWWWWVKHLSQQQGVPCHAIFEHQTFPRDQFAPFSSMISRRVIDDDRSSLATTGNFMPLYSGKKKQSRIYQE